MKLSIAFARKPLVSRCGRHIRPVIVICLVLLVGCQGPFMTSSVPVDLTAEPGMIQPSPTPTATSIASTLPASASQATPTHIPAWDPIVRKHFIPRTFTELIQIAEIHTAAPGEIGIAINQDDDFSSRLTAVYTGEFRRMSELSQSIVVAYLGENKPDLDQNTARELYATEGLFRFDQGEYWLPIQTALIASMDNTIKAGKQIYLYLSLMGSYRTSDLTNWVFVVDEYLLPKEIAKDPWQIQVFCPTQSVEAQVAFDKARALDIQGNLVDAEKYYRQAIDLDPQYCDAMDNLGFLLGKEGRLDETIQWYQKSLTIDPDNPLVLNNLGIAHKRQGEWEEAIQDFEKLIQAAPHDPEGYYSLGRAEFDLGRFSEAVAELDIAETLYFENGSPYISDAEYYLGVSYFLLGDYPRARGYLAPIYAERQYSSQINICLGYSYLHSEPQELELVKEDLLRAEALGQRLPGEWVEELVRTFGAWPPR